MGAGGVLVPPATYFEKVQAVLRKYEVLLIADEVICGFAAPARCSAPPPSACGPTSSRPPRRCRRAMCRSRPCMVSEQVHAAVAANSGKIGTFGHGFTYSGHPVTAAVALETLTHLRRGKGARACAVAGATVPGWPAPLRRPSACGRGARRGADRRDRTRSRPGHRTPFDPAMKAGARLAELALAGRPDRARHGRCRGLLPAADHHARAGRRDVRTLRPARWPASRLRWREHSERRGAAATAGLQEHRRCAVLLRADGLCELRRLRASTCCSSTRRRSST